MSSDKTQWQPLPTVVPPPHGQTRGQSGHKRVLKYFIASVLAAGLLFTSFRQYYRSCNGHGSGGSPTDKNIEARVQDILTHTPLIDGHNDFAIYIRYAFNNHINTPSFRDAFLSGTLPMHVDLARLRAGRSGGAFWSVYVPCPTDSADFSDDNYAASVRDTLQQIDLVTRLADAFPADFSSVRLNSSTARAAFAEGRLVSPMGVEGLHQIGNSIANLRRYHALGVRYATLTHNCHNRFADAALLERPFRVAEPLWGGVSPAGRDLVREMNRIGMLVDLAHVSEDTMLDVLGGRPDKWAGSRAPVMFSHSSAHSVCPHPRNVKDHVLQLVKKTRSVVMVNFSPDFVACAESGDGSGLPGPDPKHEATLEWVIKHIMHIGDLIGYDHVGIGSDFDGISGTPKGLEDVSKFPDLVAELLRRGVSDEDAAKVVGGNILRVWGEVDAVAREMQAAGELPLEDDLPSMTLEL